MPTSLAVNLAATAPKGAALGIPVLASAKGPVAPAGVSADLLSRRGFEAKPGTTLILPGSPTRILVGLGETAAITPAVARLAAAALVKAAWNETALATDLLDAIPARVDRARAAQAVAEGVLLAGYQFTSYKSNAKPMALESVTLTGKGGRLASSGLALGTAVGRAVHFSRDLINQPPGAKTPRDLAEIAEQIGAEHGLAVHVWDEHDIEREKLGGLRGVSLGSAQPPRLVKMVYEPAGATRGKRGTPTLAVVGKGITFDSGGLSLKTPDGMTTMKCDMSGAAAVLGLMTVLPQLAPPCRVIGYCCLTENMPGPHAIKPGDVLRPRNGKTIEVLNTDAEGRLVLADGLCLAVEDKVDAIVDVATLTGAIVIALGKEVTGMFSNNDGFAAQIDAAAELAGEPVWRMPMPPTYRKHIDSEVADMKNMGAPGQAGSIAAAFLLQEFVGSTPWAHLDIAGTGWADAADPLTQKGGTAAGLRTLVELTRTFARP